MHPASLVLLTAISAAELLFLFGQGQCCSIHDSISGSCSNKDGACLSSSCFPRYITDSYFKKHSYLVDSEFKDFLFHELNLASFQSSMKVSHLHRDLIGEGSHRHLFSSISFSVQPESVSLLSTPICEVIIIERLPSGVFADPFELEHLIHRGVFKDAAVFGDTNLELPSFVSNRSIVEIHMNAAIDLATAQKNALGLKIEIPVHARYQPLEKSGYTRVQFESPDFLLRCNAAEGQSNSDRCSLTSIARDINLESRSVEWSIPSGIKSHGFLVSILTFCSALFAAALIIAASLHNSDFGFHQRSKQS